MSLFSAFVRAGNFLSPRKSDVKVQDTVPCTRASTPTQQQDRSRPTRGKRERVRRARSSSGDSLSKIKEGRVEKAVQGTSTSGERRRKSPWGLPIFSAIFGRSTSPEIESEILTLEGDTIVKAEDGASTEDNESTLLADEYSQNLANGEYDTKKVKEKLLEPEDDRIQDWSEEEIWMYNKLVMRGYEPIFPHSWALDFPSFPDQLFTKDKRKCFVDNQNTSVFEASLAFNSLVRAGPNCRSQIVSGKSPELVIRRALATFHKWALRDGKVRHKHFPPLIATIVARPDESAAQVLARCSVRLHRYGRRWRQHVAPTVDLRQDIKVEGQHRQPLSRSPTLYGIVIKYSVMAIMSWDPSTVELSQSISELVHQSPESKKQRGDKHAGLVYKPLRTLGTYNWKAVGHDVWHALAVGVVECKARNFLMELAERGELGEDIVGSDPDL